MDESFARSGSMSIVLPGAAQSSAPNQTASSQTPMARKGWPRLRISNPDERFRPSPRPSCRKLMGVRILGSGSYVPDCVVTNETVGRAPRIDPGRIVRQTGIHERRQAHPSQATSDLAVEASRRAMASAGVSKTDIDLIVLGTFTPDMSFPSTACIVQDRLGVVAPAIEVE